MGNEKKGKKEKKPNTKDYQPVYSSDEEIEIDVPGEESSDDDLGIVIPVPRKTRHSKQDYQEVSTTDLEDIELNDPPKRKGKQAPREVKRELKEEVKRELWGDKHELDDLVAEIKRPATSPPRSLSFELPPQPIYRAPEIIRVVTKYLKSKDKDKKAVLQNQLKALAKRPGEIAARDDKGENVFHLLARARQDGETNDVLIAGDAKETAPFFDDALVNMIWDAASLREKRDLIGREEETIKPATLAHEKRNTKLGAALSEKRDFLRHEVDNVKQKIEKAMQGDERGDHADLERTAKNGWNVFHFIAYGDIKADTAHIRSIMEMQPDLINKKDKEGKTPLVLAVENGNLFLVEAFLMPKKNDTLTSSKQLKVLIDTLKNDTKAKLIHKKAALQLMILKNILAKEDFHKELTQEDTLKIGQGDKQALSALSEKMDALFHREERKEHNKTTRSFFEMYYERMADFACDALQKTSDDPDVLAVSLSHLAEWAKRPSLDKSGIGFYGKKMAKGVEEFRKFGTDSHSGQKIDFHTLPPETLIAKAGEAAAINDGIRSRKYLPRTDATKKFNAAVDKINGLTKPFATVLSQEIAKQRSPR